MNLEGFSRFGVDSGLIWGIVFMPDLTWFGLAVYMFSMISISLLSVVASGQLSPKFTPHKNLIRKISLASLLFCGGYFYVTIPHISPVHDFSSEESFSADTVQSDLLRGHNVRIEALERDLKRLSEQSGQLKEHFDLVFWIAWYGLVMYGTGVILSRDESKSNDDMTKLGLNEE